MCLICVSSGLHTGGCSTKDCRTELSVGIRGVSAFLSGNEVNPRGVWEDLEI